MFITEFRFAPPQSKDPAAEFDDRFQTLIEGLIAELWRSGLTLEAGANTRNENGEFVLELTALDDEAINEMNFNYDTKKLLERIIKYCGGMPRFSVLREVMYPSHCECGHPSCFILQSPPEWEGTPVKCGDCGKNIPLYRLKNSAPEREFSRLLMWRRLRRSSFAAYESGNDAGEAYASLKSCVSGLSLEGRRLAGEIERETGIMTLYPLFSQYEKKPPRCPQCGREWRNPYNDAIKYEYYCRACRLVM